MLAENNLLRCVPETQGLSSSDILGFVEAVEANIHDLHSFMLLRHGAVVAEGWWSPYAPERPHMLFSLSKSFASSGIGLAVAEGRLSVDDLVVSFFPDDLPAQIDPNLARMRVRDLLTMSTGHAQDSTERMRASGDWVKGFLSLAVEHEPDTYFVYNSGATYMLSAIVQKLTGMKLVDYLQPRLFEPLGITGAAWEISPQGINSGGWGLSIKTEDIARFGQMYLQKGVWNGKRILPEAWVAAATSYQVPNNVTQTNSDWTQGYGYQFWRCRHNAYRGDGAFGQYCIVMPDQDVVLAITSGLGDMQQVLDLVWDKLLPAMQPGVLPENQPAQTALMQKLASLKLVPPAGQTSSPLTALVSGKTYTFATNPINLEALTFQFNQDGCTLTAKSASGEQMLSCGLGKWQKGMTGIFEGNFQPVAASGVWTDTQTFAITARLFETPFYFTLTFGFLADQVTMQVKQNVAFGPTEMPPMVGHLG